MPSQNSRDHIFTRLQFLGAPGGVVLLAVLALLPVLLAPHLMLLDAPAHELRVEALRNLLITGRGSAFYGFDTFFLPNVSFDAIGLGLVSVMSPETAGRIFFASIMLLTPSGIAFLNRVAIGRWSIIPFASVLLIYNLVTILGFFSYSFGLALVPWALAARLKLQNSAVKFAPILGSVFALVLLFCHVFAFGIYAVMSTGFTLSALLKRDISLGKASVASLELLPAALLFLCMSTGGGFHASYNSPFFHAKLFGLAKSLTSGSMSADIAFLVGGTCFLALLAFCRRLRIVGSFYPGLLGLVALYFILPANMASGSYVDARMPIAIALLFMASLDYEFRRGWVPLVLLFSLLVALIVKQVAITVLWRSFSGPVDKIVSALEASPVNSVVMQSECAPDANDVFGVYRSRQPPMQHVAALSGFDGTRFIPAAYAIRGQQTIRVLSTYQPYYDLQATFAPSCSISDYKIREGRIKTLAAAQLALGHPIPPLYFLLIRPPQMLTALPGAILIAEGQVFKLYKIVP